MILLMKQEILESYITYIFDLGLNDDDFLFIHFVMHYGQKVLTQWPRAFEHGFLTIQHREIYKDFLLQNQFPIPILNLEVSFIYWGQAFY